MDLSIWVGATPRYPNRTLDKNQPKECAANVQVQYSYKTFYWVSIFLLSQSVQKFIPTEILRGGTEILLHIFVMYLLRVYLLNFSTKAMRLGSCEHESICKYYQLINLRFQRKLTWIGNFTFEAFYVTHNPYPVMENIRQLIFQYYICNIHFLVWQDKRMKYFSCTAIQFQIENCPQMDSGSEDWL